ncbi:hypothetical protein [Streptomyces acidicola]|uniref:hypothetical protein n=1 Tax=Streptomyces acidicola TaxID=2596892 RepID=UPI0018839CF2|nr:hypothetical protein [Streptomyces acidicola]
MTYATYATYVTYVTYVTYAAYATYRWLSLLKRHRHDTAKPGTPRTADQPAGAESLGLLHRERSGAEHVPIGTADDGAFHQVQESLPQEPRRAYCPDDESHITG